MTKKSAREVILEVAVTEIIENGVSVTGLNSVLRRSGFSKGAFYHHFSSKKGLTEALLSEVLANKLSRSWIKPLERSKQPWNDLKRLSNNAIGGIFEGSGGHFELFLILLHSREALDSSCQVLLDSLLSDWLSSIERALRLAHRKGEIANRLDERAWAWLLLGALQSLRQLSKNSDKKLEWKGVLRNFFKVLESQS